eukprot:6212144-Pleurochrysis_carterae.AAC.5
MRQRVPRSCTARFAFLREEGGAFRSPMDRRLRGGEKHRQTARHEGVNLVSDSWSNAEIGLRVLCGRRMVRSR